MAAMYVCQKCKVYARIWSEWEHVAGQWIEGEQASQTGALHLPGWISAAVSRGTEGSACLPRLPPPGPSSLPGGPGILHTVQYCECLSLAGTSPCEDDRLCFVRSKGWHSR